MLFYSSVQYDISETAYGILQFPVSSPVGPLCSSKDLPEDDALALALVVPESPPAVNLPSWRRPLASSLCASKSPNELPKSASSVTSRYSVIVSVSTSPWKRAWRENHPKIWCLQSPIPQPLSLNLKLLNIKESIPFPRKLWPGVDSMSRRDWFNFRVGTIRDLFKIDFLGGN